MLEHYQVDASARLLETICGNMRKAIFGKDRQIQTVVLALVAGGHVLIEDVPGVGKTSLVSALAKSIDCGFKRIQFTPDVVPSDVTGFSVFNQRSGEFEFRPGSIMTNLVLADEINRASAKTQSALLEAMEERQVTVDAKTYELADPFMVLATQNPVEQYGTYPLPEAQLDRFIVKLSLGYADFQSEVQIYGTDRRAKAHLKSVATAQDIVSLRSQSREVYINPVLLEYIGKIVFATRQSPDLMLGASPRAGIALVDMSRCHALMQGRNYVLPDDVQALASLVLSHRVMLSHEAKAARTTSSDVVESLVSSVRVPRGELHGTKR